MAVPCGYLSSFFTLSSIVHAANIEIRARVKWSLPKGQKQWKIDEPSVLKSGIGRL